jgi:hypothetical protein
MAQSVSIQAVTDIGLYGPTYGPAMSYACYVKQEIKNIKDKDGNDVVSSCQFYLDGHPSIGYDAKIAYGEAYQAILKIQKRFDEHGGAYATIIYP